MDGYDNSASRRRFATGFFSTILLVLLASTTSIIDTVAWANGELPDALRNMTLDRQFLADLAAIRAWRREGGRLHMDLTGGGTMVFTAASREQAY